MVRERQASLIFVVLNIIDCIITAWAVRHGGLNEMNPAMAWAIREGIFIPLKLALGTGAAALLWYRKSNTAVFAVGLYTLVIAWNIGNILMR